MILDLQFITHGFLYHTQGFFISQAHPTTVCVFEVFDIQTITDWLRIELNWTLIDCPGRIIF